MPHAFYAEQRRRGASDADIFTMGIQEEPWQHLANFTTKAEDIAPPFAFQDYYTPALGGQGGAVARLSRYETVSELCSGFLRRLNVSAFDRLYRAAAYPSISPRRPSGKAEGCVVGLGGMEMRARLAPWSGKDFGANGEVMNLGWSEGMETVRGTYGIGRSWDDLKTPALIIQYKEEELDWAVRAFEGPLGIRFKTFRDEIREVWPGLFLGKVFVRPNQNPGSSVSNGWLRGRQPFRWLCLHFALIQKERMDVVDDNNNLVV